MHFTGGARCPECGSTNCVITPYGLVCEDCGALFIPDGWLDDLEETEDLMDEITERLEGEK